MKKINIAINGFGRIGRAALKVIWMRYPNLNIVAINDLTDPETLAHLLQYDSCYGSTHQKISASKDSIIIDGHKIPILAVKNPEELPWKELKVDIVLECTGRFTNKEDLSMHLKAGAKKVVLSAPAKKGGVKTIVMGVNLDKVNKGDHLLSCASCTTNCLAPVTKIVKDAFGIKKALMTTVHSYTADQNLVDGPHKDLRRARAAAVNIIPTTTGAAISTTETIPSLKDKFDGLAVRVPTPVGSIECIWPDAEFRIAGRGHARKLLRAQSFLVDAGVLLGRAIHQHVKDRLHPRRAAVAGFPPAADSTNDLILNGHSALLDLRRSGFDRCSP